MESIGEKLKSARERLNYSIDQAARDTHIAKRFIEAMESERFEVFPGESYLIGFLRNYSKFLDLDSEDMVSLYRNTQIQEQASPIDELLEPRRSIRPLHLLLGLAGTGLLAAAIFFLARLPDPQTQPVRAAQPEAASSSIQQTLLFNGEILEQEILPWTAIQIPLEDGQYQIEIHETGNPLTLHIDGTMTELSLDGVAFLDLNGDETPDLRTVFVSSQQNGNPVIRLDRVVAGIFAQQNQESQEDINAPVQAGLTSEPSRERSILSTPGIVEGQEFLVELLFRGPVLLRSMNEQGEQEERMYQSGERFIASVDSYLYLWMSNAGKLQFSIAGQNLRLGRDGEVLAVRIQRNGTEAEILPVY